MAVTFFGYDFEKEKLLSIDSQLYNTIEKLILNGQGCFIISGNNMFDRLAGRNLLLLKNKYPYVRICKICADKKPDVFSPFYSKIRRIKCPKAIAEFLCRKYAVNEADIIVSYIKNADESFSYAVEKDIIRII